MAEFLRQLPEPLEVRFQLLERCRQDLSDLGVSARDVWNDVVLGTRHPARVLLTAAADALLAGMAGLGRGACRLLRPLIGALLSAIVMLALIVAEYCAVACGVLSLGLTLLVAGFCMRIVVLAIWTECMPFLHTVLLYLLDAGKSATIMVVFLCLYAYGCVAPIDSPGGRCAQCCRCALAGPKSSGRHRRAGSASPFASSLIATPHGLALLSEPYLAGFPEA
jgi:hypothetical protein